jgi:predicted metal-dependent enzyme (double-stranded beta helix superfamily)
MFDIDTFIADCNAALSEAEPRVAIKELLGRAISEPASVEAALPASIAELFPLYHSADLTIMKVIWAPAMAVPPHDHLMWAAIGIYGGEEDNAFFRRGGERIVSTGGKQLTTGDTALLGGDVIHAVVNPRQHSYTAAIHIYGGDFLNKPRSMWDPETLEEQPATAETMRRFFDQANQKQSKL